MHIYILYFSMITPHLSIHVAPLFSAFTCQAHEAQGILTAGRRVHVPGQLARRGWWKRNGGGSLGTICNDCSISLIIIGK